MASAVQNLSGDTATGRRDRAAGLLALAAAPTFAIMALVSGRAGDTDMLCSSVQAGLPLSPMATMYVLMSAFHLAPWLTLMFGRTAARENAMCRNPPIPRD
jgi:hypothetical protein